MNDLKCPLCGSRVVWSCYELHDGAVGHAACVRSPRECGQPGALCPWVGFIIRRPGDTVELGPTNEQETAAMHRVIARFGQVSPLPTSTPAPTAAPAPAPASPACTPSSLYFRRPPAHCEAITREGSHCKSQRGLAYLDDGRYGDLPAYLCAAHRQRPPRRVDRHLSMQQAEVLSRLSAYEWARPTEVGSAYDACLPTLVRRGLAERRPSPTKLRGYEYRLTLAGATAWPWAY